MGRIVYDTLNKISQLVRININRGHVKFMKLQYSSATSNATSEEMIKNILLEKFPQAKTIEVEDTSGGCGAMYKIYIESNDFKNMSLLKQHKSVYAALDKQIKQVHGLHLVTKVPK